MSYVERLTVPWWWWLLALTLVGSLAAAVLAYVPLTQGLLIVALFAVAVIAIMFGYGHTAVRVAGGALHVGRYRVEGQWIAGAEALESQDSARALSVGGNPDDFLVTRPYIADVVRVTINDIADPHPHWLISSRRAHHLAEAVNSISVQPS